MDLGIRAWEVEKRGFGLLILSLGILDLRFRVFN